MKIGIIGFGYMGHFHLNKVRSLDTDAVVTAVYDINPEKREDARGEGLMAFDNLEEFLAQDTELVVIATPNEVHATLSIACLEAGKNVMCEKPVTMNSAELEQVIACANRCGRLFTTHQNRRWDVDYRAVKEMLRSGQIGAPTTIESMVFGERGVCFGWRGDPAHGGGMLYDWGVHLIDQALCMFEGHKVVNLYARLTSILTPAVDDFFEVGLDFDNGVHYTVSVGTFALQKRPRWFVFGDRGTLKLDDFSGKTGGASRIRERVTGFDSVFGKTSLGPSRTMAPLQKEMLEVLPLPEVEEQPLAFWQNLVAAVKGEEEPIVKHEQLLRQMKVIDAAFACGRTNSSMRVDI